MTDRIKVRFDYEIVPRKSVEMDARDFDGCETFEELMDELREQAPDAEWSVYPDERAARELWAVIESRRAGGHITTAS